MKEQTVSSFFEEMSEDDFEAKFSKLSGTDEFSAVASGIGNATDIAKVKEALRMAGLHAEWLEKDWMFKGVVRHITARFVNKVI